MLLTIMLSAAVGCSITPTAHVDLEAATGCSSVRIEESVRGETTTIHVQATDCDAAGNVIYEAAADRVAGAVWQSLRRPVDIVEIRLPAIGSPSTESVEIQGSNLAARFEVGATAPKAQAHDAVWFLLPAAYVAAAVVMVLLARRMNQAGLIIVLFK